MARLLSGKEVAAWMQQRSKEAVEKLRENGVAPCLAIFRVGENKSDLSYEKGLLKSCQSLDILCERKAFPEDVAQEELLRNIARANEDPRIHGILVFRPLPAHIDQAQVENAVNPEKDVDGMTAASMAHAFTGGGPGFLPCTPQACMEILDYYQIDCKGKKAAVIGRSLVVGKPAAMMLVEKNATVTICHSKTENLREEVRDADIVLAAVGRAGFLDGSYFSPGQIVLDVGIHVNAQGKLCGDVDQTGAEAVVEAITPVPGGVGSVTTSVLLEHVVKAACAAVRKSR